MSASVVSSARLRQRARLLVPRWLGLEDLAVFCICAAVFVFGEWAVLVSRHIYESDAAIHLAWARQWWDSSLFHDSMTRELQETGFPPPGPRAIYQFASLFGDPIIAAEWLSVVIAAGSCWLLFRIVRNLTAWRPAAWLAAGLFLFAWDIARVRGGFPHSFAHLIVLATVALSLARRPPLAALVPPLGALFYPPAALIGLGVLGVTCIASFRPPRLDVRRTLLTLGSLCLVFVIVRTLLPEADTFTLEEARTYPEFGPGSTIHFFGSPVVDMLRQNYTGFDLRRSGSVLLVGALLLLAIARTRLPREIWAMPIVALALFLLAYAVLFKLYLPTRYSYPLLPFSAIVIGATVEPAWRRLQRVRLRYGAPILAALVPLVVFIVAMFVFPIGPFFAPERIGDLLLGVLPWACGGVVLALLVGLGRRLLLGSWPPALGALLVGAVLLAEVAWGGGIGRRILLECPPTSMSRYLASLPADTVVAGSPTELTCVPLAARRPVVINIKQFQPMLSRTFFLRARVRMRAAVRAYYGDSYEPILAMNEKYGADLFLVTRQRVRNPRVWRRREPYKRIVLAAEQRPGRPASLRLPEECVEWQDADSSLYDLRCVSDWVAAQNATASAG